MAGPKYSNRKFKVFENKEIHLTSGDYILEAWAGRDFEKQQDIEGALDIKIYARDDTAPYGKGDQKAFFRMFENTGEKKNSSVADTIEQSQNIMERANVTKEFDDDIPF
jgi:hypothetical protein